MSKTVFSKFNFNLPVLKGAWHTIVLTKYVSEMSLDRDVLLTRHYNLTSCYFLVNLANSHSHFKVLHVHLLSEACTRYPLPSRELFTFPTNLPEHLWYPLHVYIKVTYKY